MKSIRSGRMTAWAVSGAAAVSIGADLVADEETAFLESGQQAACDEVVPVGGKRGVDLSEEDAVTGVHEPGRVAE